MKRRDRESESQRNRGTEKHTIRRRQKIPPLAACVNTLPEAVALSLKDGLTENCLFILARAIKAFEIKVGRKLPPAELTSAFALWWRTAKSLLPADADFDEYRFVFENAYARARSPLGADHLREAIRRADSNPPPPQAIRYTSPRIKRLIAVCYHLHVLAGNGEFFLSVRDAARIAGKQSPEDGRTLLGGLVRDGILIEVAKGTPGGKRATRFRFNLRPSGPGEESQTNAE